MLKQGFFGLFWREISSEWLTVVVWIEIFVKEGEKDEIVSI